MKQLETDVAVIGGGCAGMAAAATVAERGVQVVAFEKSAKLASGGNGPFAAESRLQRMKRMTFTREDALKLLLQHTRYRIDARLAKAYIYKSASTIDWLETMGVGFIEPVAYYPGAQATWHYKDPDTPRITDALANRAKELGASIYLETPAKKILKGGGVL